MMTRNGQLRCGSGTSRRPDGERAQHGGESDHARQRDEPTEPRAEQYQQQEAADGVGRDPLGRERQTQQHADDGHHQR